MQEPTREYCLGCTTPTGSGILVLHGHHLEIGRGGYANIRVDDHLVAPQHARLEFVCGRWRVTDLGSQNGTFRGGWRLAPYSRTPLRDGDVLRMGSCEFLFIDQAEWQFTDRVTRLPNHRAFEDAQLKCGLGDALVLFWIKSDNAGYVPGDSLIDHVGRIVRNIVPPIGDVFRHETGGFAAILPDCPRATANRLVATIRQALAECRRHSGEEQWTPVLSLRATVYVLA